MKNIRNNERVEPKWMNGEMKRLKETKIAYQIQKNSLDENHQI